MQTSQQQPEQRLRIFKPYTEEERVELYRRFMDALHVFNSLVLYNRMGTFSSARQSATSPNSCAELLFLTSGYWAALAFLVTIVAGQAKVLLLGLGIVIVMVAIGYFDSRLARNIKTAACNCSPAISPFFSRIAPMNPCAAGIAAVAPTARISRN